MAKPLAEHAWSIPFGVAAVTADAPSATRAALVVGQTLRLNDAGWDFAEAPDASRLADRAAALAFLRDALKRLCDPWAAHQRRFLDAYFTFVAASITRAAPELAARLARFGDLYRVEDFQFSAVRPLPRAHVPDADGWVAVDFAFWTGAALIAIDIADGRRTARRLAADHARLAAAGVAVVALPPEALTGDAAGFAARLPAPLVRFLDDEALPSSPFKAVALGDIVDADAPPIRRATPADVARISEIRFAVRENRLADPSRVTPADVAWFIEHPGIWVWDDGGRIVGFAAADPRDATIWALFVDPAHERRGIGRALLDAACGVLRAAGHPFATLTTDPGTRAERFYRAGGWTAVGRNARGEIVFQSPLLMGD